MLRIRAMTAQDVPLGMRPAAYDHAFASAAESMAPPGRTGEPRVLQLGLREYDQDSIYFFGCSPGGPGRSRGSRGGDKPF